MSPFHIAIICVIGYKIVKIRCISSRYEINYYFFYNYLRKLFMMSKCELLVKFEVPIALSLKYNINHGSLLIKNNCNIFHLLTIPKIPLII